MVNWIVPSRGGRTSRSSSTYKFRFSNQKAGGKQNIQGVIGVHESAMKELRWVVGDKIVFSFDKNFVYIKRVPSMGFALSGAGVKKSSCVGKMVSATVKSSKFVFPSSEVIYANEYKLDGDVIVISYKEQQ